MNCPTPQELLDAVNGVTDAAGLRAHLDSCADCRSSYDGMMAATESLARGSSAPAVGPCLDAAKIAAYARHAIGGPAVQAHLASCGKCLDELVALSETLDEEPGEVPDGLRQQVLAIVPRRRTNATTRSIPVIRATRRSMRPAGPPAFVWGIAAALFFAVVILLAVPKGTVTESPVVKDRPAPVKRETAEVPKETPGPVVEVPKKVEPKPVVAPPKPEAPKPVVEAPKPVVAPPKKEEPKPVVEAPKPAPKSAVEVARYVPVVLSQVRGELRRGAEKLASGARVDRGDDLVTDRRHVGAFAVEGYSGSLALGSTVRLEQREGGETRVTLSAGSAFFEVAKREQPFVVAGPHAEAVVVGTAFQVSVAEKATALFVLEGAVKFKNAKGEVLVKAGQRSVARANERPSTPARYDVEGETAWRKRPDLALGEVKKEPWIEQVPGAKMPGLVVAAPYASGETAGGRLAVATAELLDAGLVLGHHHRDRVARIWLNIDRGTEGVVGADGSLPALGSPTERAKKVTQEYLGHLRAAAGVGPRDAVPMVVNLRMHSDQQGGAELEVCEVAWTGWQQRTIGQAKALYAQLLEKHKPGYRLEMRFEGIDATYDHKGVKRTFKFTESDAEADGYMAPRHAQRAIAFFFNLSMGRLPASDAEAYARILAELTEFLYERRR
jgi:hypothetical protein